MSSAIASWQTTEDSGLGWMQLEEVSDGAVYKAEDGEGSEDEDEDASDEVPDCLPLPDPPIPCQRLLPLNL